MTRGQAVGTRFSGRVHAAAILATIVATSPLAQRAAAQAVEPRPPTPAECRAAIAALRRHSTESSDWVQTAGCGKSGGKALAAALRAGASDPDTAYLHALLGTLSRIRDPAVFRSALDVGRSPAALPYSRVVALLTAVAQLDNYVALDMRRGPADILNHGSAARCFLSGMMEDVGGYSSTTPLPRDAATQLARTLESIATSAAPAPIRGAARCFRVRISHLAPMYVPRSRIDIAYVCGNRFRYRNNSSEGVILTYKVRARANGPVLEEGDIDLAPGQERVFETDSTGAIDTYQEDYPEDGGRMDRMRPNRGRPCP